MFLLDEPYVSDFLIRTIRDQHFPLIRTPFAQKLLPDNSFKWVAEDEAIARLSSESAPQLYSNSENALGWIGQHLADSELAYQISVLKDKVKFRQLLQDLFPDFYFRELPLVEVQEVAAAELTFPLVIKPSVGFFSIGVHVLHREADWLVFKDQLDPQKLQRMFPTTVLDTRTFILEALIPGEEFAIDYYYDEHGKVVLLNVLHHVFSSGTDTSDRVYTTSQDIVAQHRQRIEDFLSVVGDRLNLKNFPAHAEIRIDGAGRIMPIEINPLRFGGWCTTADLLGVTLDFNIYACFARRQQPDWEQVFAGKAQQLFSIVVLDNRSGLAPDQIAGFDYDKLAQDFENPILIREFDIQQYPVFGFVFAETSPARANELQRILVSDLRRYILAR
jgi:hypothetical protein